MAQTKAHLKALRKKYHLGEFRLTTVKRKSSTKRKGGNPMARKKRHSVSSKGGRLMTGILRPSGIIGAALLGAGAATIADNMGISQAVPYGKYVAGGAVGGLGGVLGVFARDMIKGQITTGTSGGISSVY